MGIDCLSFFQDRMSRAYEEQIWAVAIVAGMNAFIANQAEQLLEAFKYRTTVICVSFLSILAILFVWSRHIIFVHYDTIIKTAFTNAANCSIKIGQAIPVFCEYLARISGVSFYTVVILGMSIIAIKKLYLQNKQNLSEPGA